MPPLLFIDYANLVAKTFEEKRDSNQLSQLLLHPTTSNIRQECFNIYTERIKKGEEEENTLRAFFGVPPAGKNFAYIIERHNLDKFRPLQSLIKKEIKNPALVNVELLAWLIDFSPRPLSQAQKVLRSTNEPIILGKPTIDTIQNGTGYEEELKKKVTGREELENPLEIPEQERGDKKLIPQTSLEGVQKNETEKSRPKRGVLLFLAFIICAGGIYTIWQSKQDKQIVIGNANAGCMYWAGDSYKEMPCNEERSGRFKWPMDPKKMKNFRRITQEDTITERSIGSVYYIKIDGRIEYYTASGNHPVDVNRPLKVLSRYMFDTHLRKKDPPDNDSLAKQTTRVVNNH